jgi:lipid II:glycine glycyltransferase (peptidoglycan interpeptide bridge formation enzyme)
VPDEVLTQRVDPAAPWGLETFSAWDGPTLLAAALVGWAGNRAYYVMGGATPDGDRASASVWLQWRIMSLLIERGCRQYSLGGSPAAAAAPAHAAHALYRFRTAFGADVLECRGARWEYGRAHLFTHDVARRMAGLLHTGA